MRRRVIMGIVALVTLAAVAMAIGARCNYCNGTGRNGDYRCSYCNGSGFNSEY